MRFDKEALGCGLTLYSQLENSKAELVFTAYIMETEDNQTVSGKERKVEFCVLDREDREVVLISIPAQQVCTVRSLLIYPHLWQSVEDPYLYRVRALLLDGEEILDEVTAYHAFRAMDRETWDGFRLNEKPFHLKGIRYEADALKQETGGDQLKTDLKLIRELGANTVCLSGSLDWPDFYQICEELGLLIWYDGEKNGSAEIPLFAGKEEYALLTEDHLRRRDMFFYYKACWTQDPFVYLCGHARSYEGERLATVQVYSNQKKIALYVDGVLFEIKESSPCFIYDNVPLEKAQTIISAQAGDCYMAITIKKSQRM